MRRATILVSTLAAWLAFAAPAEAQRGQVALPEGDGKDVVEIACTTCHGLGQINGSAGYDAAGWRDLLGTMVSLPDAQATRAAGYLARHFPPKPDQAPALVAGNAQIAITEWTAPTLGQRVRDPADRRLDTDSDGSVWYGNSTMGRIGRLDPGTGEIREWPSPSGPDSHPYALAVVDDIIWYNESGMRPDALVRFDPATEEFQSWPIPSGYGIVRNMWVTEDGNLLIHQSSSNRIGLVEIQRPRLTSQP
ncbi:MAG: hypothetical protein OEO79_17040 [Gemmatimonadota bacterium]|nr:hypothetical protein [Gemmatimonadota bacterium]